MANEKPSRFDPVPGGAGTKATESMAASAVPMETDEVIDTLNELLESCRDGEYGFQATAEHAKSVELKDVLTRHASQCREAGVELQTLIRQLGGKPEVGGSVSGALHRGWVSVRATLSRYSDLAMLEECERGENVSLVSYHKALKSNLPPAVREVVERQTEGVQRNYDEIKAMRSSLKAAH